MNETPGIRSDSQGVAKVVAAAGIMGAAIGKPIQKVLKDKAKKRADAYNASVKETNQASEKSAAKKASKKEFKRTKELLQVSSKADRKMVKTVRKQANKLQAQPGTKVTMSTPISSASFTRNNPSTSSKPKATTPRQSTARASKPTGSTTSKTPSTSKPRATRSSANPVRTPRKK